MNEQDELIKRLENMTPDQFYRLVMALCNSYLSNTIDPVHAAGGCYCRECNFRDSDGRCEPLKNGLIIEFTEPNDFCSYGERKEVH